MEFGKKLIYKIVYEVVSTLFIWGIVLFVMIGMQRVWELNSEKYVEMKPFCEPIKPFGLKYDCDLVAYNNYLKHKQIYDSLNLTINFSQIQIPSYSLD